MERDKHTECYTCSHMGKIPGDAHIQCRNPPPEMPGDIRGLQMGWFQFPANYDPAWKLELCPNYNPTTGGSNDGK